jgi:hypothetical protein
LNVEKLRTRIYERIFNAWWRGARYILIGGAATFAACAATALQLAKPLFLGLGSAGLVASAVATLAWKALAEMKAEKEPAAVALGEYLRMPDYAKEIGFVHQVEADVRGALGAVPASRRPIVIFIDDLDRCSPTKVAQIVEAVNLFLAGELPDCMFVLGMDSEMVAAALQAAHADLTKNLPADAAIPVGWRFMDKFIQLPFLIPPAEPADVERYSSSLLSRGPTEIKGRLAQAIDAAAKGASRATLDTEVAIMASQLKLDEESKATARRRLETALSMKEIDEGVSLFNDANPEIRRLLRDATAAFSRNPRELKRFVNAFRFHYFLWWAQRAQSGKPGPSLSQLQRFVIFSMKWPEVVRWVRRGDGMAGADLEVPKGASVRLRRLEESVMSAADAAGWASSASTALRLDKATPWLSDAELFQFLHSSRLGDRLSDASGQGLW